MERYPPPSDYNSTRNCEVPSEPGRPGIHDPRNMYSYYPTDVITTSTAAYHSSEYETMRHQYANQYSPYYVQQVPQRFSHPGQPRFSQQMTPNQPPRYGGYVDRIHTSYEGQFWQDWQRQQQELYPVVTRQLNDMSSSAIGVQVKGGPTLTPAPAVGIGGITETLSLKIETDRVTPPLDDDTKKVTKKPVILVGKRRGGRVLPTGNLGIAKKPRTQAEKGRSDEWSRYMAEVKRYKEHSCEEDRKNRPLVK